MYLMRCAKGICAGFRGCTRFSLLRWGKKGLRLPLAVEKGSETPAFSRSEHEERGSLRPLFPPQEGVSDPFSHRKRENLIHPRNPLAQIPLAQRMSTAGANIRVSLAVTLNSIETPCAKLPFSWFLSDNSWGHSPAHSGPEGPRRPLSVAGWWNRNTF